MKKLKFLIILPLILAILGCQKDALSTNKDSNNQLLSSLDQTVEKVVRPYLLKHPELGISIAISQNKQRFYYGYGRIKKDTSIIPKPETVFEIGSITKTFTAALICSLATENRLKLTDEVNQYLPQEIPPLTKNGVPVRIFHLLNHTSGFPSWPEDFTLGIDPTEPCKHYNEAKILDYLKNNPVKTEPGTTFEYSNLGMAVAGLIIEKLSQTSYEKYLIQKILDPLKLNQIRVYLPNNRATGYNHYEVPTSWEQWGGFLAAGSLEATSVDLLRYAEAQYAEHDLLYPIFNACHQPTFFNGVNKLGLAWSIYEDLLIHGGKTGGFNSILLISKNKKTAFLVWINHSEFDAGNLALNLAKEILN